MSRRVYSVELFVVAAAIVLGADMDGDGDVDAADVNRFVRLLLGLPPNCTP